MTESDELARWVTQYAAAAAEEANVAAFVEHVDRAILAGIPEMAADAVLTTELHASTRSQFRAFLNLLDHERMDVALPPQATALALSIARRGLELGVLLKIYREAQDAVWQFFTMVADAVPEGGPDHTDVLKYLWGRGGRWINEAIEQLIAVYLTERDALQQGKLARRTATIQSLLRGELLPTDETSDVLAHPLRDHQTAVVLWIDQGHADPSPTELDTVASQIGAALGGGRPLSLPAGHRELWLWVASRKVPDTTALTSLGNDLARRVGGLRVAVGQPSRGLAGFVTSHREARSAQRCAVQGPHHTVTRYADVELVSMLAADPAAAAELARRELGGLIRDEAGLEKVRETLATFLRHAGNVEQTASALIVHKNTIRYRIAQAETLIGHSLGERRTELDLALRYVAHHPELLTAE